MDALLPERADLLLREAGAPCRRSIPGGRGPPGGSESTCCSGDGQPRVALVARSGFFRPGILEAIRRVGWWREADGQPRAALVVRLGDFGDNSEEEGGARPTGSQALPLSSCLICPTYMQKREGDKAFATMPGENICLQHVVRWFAHTSRRLMNPRRRSSVHLFVSCIFGRRQRVEFGMSFDPSGLPAHVDFCLRIWSQSYWHSTLHPLPQLLLLHKYLKSHAKTKNIKQTCAASFYSFKRGARSCIWPFQRTRKSVACATWRQSFSFASSPVHAANKQPRT